MRSRIAETADTIIRYMGYALSVLSTQLEGAWLLRLPEHIEVPLGSRQSSCPVSDGHSSHRHGGPTLPGEGSAADTGSDKDYRVD